jgi:hypothetical protein
LPLAQFICREAKGRSTIAKLEWLEVYEKAKTRLLTWMRRHLRLHRMPGMTELMPPPLIED